MGLENGMGSSRLWSQVTGLYGITLLSDRVNFQVSRVRSFARAPNLLSRSARLPITKRAFLGRFYLTPAHPECPAPAVGSAALTFVGHKLASHLPASRQLLHTPLEFRALHCCILGQICPNVKLGYWCDPICLMRRASPIGR